MATDISDDSLARTVSRALRHAPESYYLEIDSDGWVSIEHLLLAICYDRREWRDVDMDRLRRVVTSIGGEDMRFEIQGNFIRALYGHSASSVLAHGTTSPPPILYHGTSKACFEAILRTNLRPMGRNYVHLSSDWNYADNVAKRVSQLPIVLLVRAGEAAKEGIVFRRANGHVWLAEMVPARFLFLNTGPSGG